jgi:hypothetical protein
MMSPPRPTVAAQLVAAMIETTPDRVRRRLDQAPQAAASWRWEATAEAWSVDTGGETVILPLEHVVAVEHVRCTCLLSPRCFHVLACLTSLAVANEELATEMESIETDSAPGADAPEIDAIAPSLSQKHAVRDLVTAVEQVLRVGAANAGVVLQSGLLRAVHQCRAESLHRLAAIGLRVLSGMSELRARGRSSDPVQLAEDIADLLECARHVDRDAAVDAFWFGAARRAQRPVHPRKLHGLFAEPIMTRSGFAGAAVYFLGEDDIVYSVSDVRPGDAQRARDAYQGGIDIGPLVQPARQLARGLYVGADLTAARDGRLGRGKRVRIVAQGSSTWRAEAVQQRFERSLAVQRNDVFARAAVPADAQPTGWDFLFLKGVVLGAVGAELLVQTSDQSVRLAIANESPTLLFRENLRMLSHAPGLRLEIIARLSPIEPDVAFALAIAAGNDEAAGERLAGEPYLELPASLAGRVCLGFDALESKHIIHRQPTARILSDGPPPPAMAAPLESLRRRWIATMQSGFASQRQGKTNSLAAEMASLARNGFKTGAELLDALTRNASETHSIDGFLATAIYLRHCRFELARKNAC